MSTNDSGNHSSRLVRLAPVIGAGSAAAAIAIAGVLAAGVVSDAHATTVGNQHVSTVDQGGTGSSSDSTGGIGAAGQGQAPVARSNGS